MKPPKIEWIKFDKNKHKYFNDGDRFLLAFYLLSKDYPEGYWEFEAVKVKIYNGERISLVYDSTGDHYGTFEFRDCEYFHIIEGSEPTTLE